MKKLLYAVLSMLILMGCSQQCPTVEPCQPCEEVVKDEAYYIAAITEYEQQKIVGTWEINEHQTITFNDDGTGYIWDDGSGTLREDDGENTYDLTYQWWDDGRITMMFSMNFSCELGATAIYPITFFKDKLIFQQNYINENENDIVCTKVN